MRKLIPLIAYCIILYLLAVAGCQTSSERDEAASRNDADTVSLGTAPEDSVIYSRAFATINPASGSELQGSASFTDQGDGKVTFKISVEGARPGEHAVHLHENGDCSMDDASGAGGHWAPHGNPHGKRNVDLRHHKGDLDNMRVGEDGTGELAMTVLGWSVGGPDSTNILNKAVVIHAGADDFASQPSGNAGARVGCGVIIGVE